MEAYMPVRKSSPKPEANCVTPSPSRSSPICTPSRQVETVDRPNNVYVKCFSHEVDDKKLHDMFQAYGEIISCTVLHDHSGRSKQVGFVQFSTEAEAHLAVKEMHGQLGHGIKPLHVALTNRKPVTSQKKSPTWREGTPCMFKFGSFSTPFRQPTFTGADYIPPSTPSTQTPSAYSSRWSSSPPGTVPFLFYYPPYPYGGYKQQVAQALFQQKGAQGSGGAPTPYYPPYLNPYMHSPAIQAYPGPTVDPSYSGGWGGPVRCPASQSWANTYRHPGYAAQFAA